VRIASIYRKPDSDIKTFNKILEERLQEWKKRKVVICGDTNLDIIKEEDHKDTRDYINKLNENGFSLKIKCPTRVTTKSATCIDHIATNIQTEAHGVVVTDISDHMPVFTALRTSKTGFVEDVTTKQRKLNDQQISKVKEQLSAVDWSIINRFNLDDAYGLLVSKIKDAIKGVKDARPNNKKGQISKNHG